ncbi:hypothetical protein J437_LFUL007872 [Ladona fulva]|uniref:Spaetzle domain-containing protein n=1 Tax=Ladona fulva TaxID=123851 RepID=A0A8K0NVU8_LADFU|nr:hypothetical protein J437_LFUL007872 [Ladona fulva]
MFVCNRFEEWAEFRKLFGVCSACKGLFTVGGRPQIGEYMPVSRPLIPFSRSDTRDTIIMNDRPSSQVEHRPPSQMEQRPRQGIVYSDEPYHSRVRSDQIQQSTVTNHDRRIVLDPTRAKDRKNTDEQPVWLPKSETHSTERRDGSTRPQINPSHVHDKRGNTRPENRGPSNRGQQSNANSPVNRMGTIEVPIEDYSISRNESIGDARRVLPQNVFHKKNSGDIVFPGPTRDPSLPSRINSQGSFAPTPNCEEGSTFCTSADNYPRRQESQCSLTEGFPLGYKTVCRQKYIYRRLLALNEDGKTHSDMFRLPSCCACFLKSINDIAERIDFQDETPLCPSLEQVVYPKMAQNKDDKWLYVVNQDPYVQGVRVEKCL